jgi:hypothetical protein
LAEKKTTDAKGKKNCHGKQKMEQNAKKGRVTVRSSLFVRCCRRRHCQSNVEKKVMKKQRRGKEKDWRANVDSYLHGGV